MTKLSVSPYIAERINRKKSDFRIDTFSTGGPGGANQNSVNAGVRLTCKITGLSSEGREFRDQPQNKAAAFRKLVQKLIEFYRKEELALVVKTADEGSVRTYKEKNSLVIDSRASKTYNYEEILDGKLDDLLNDIRLEIKKIEKT